MDKDVDASFEMVEQDILQTRERAAELNGSTNTLKTPVGGQMNQSNNATDGSIQNEMGRLSPSNLRAHNQEFNLARFVSQIQMNIIIKTMMMHKVVYQISLLFPHMIIISLYLK